MSLKPPGSWCVLFVLVLLSGCGSSQSSSVLPITITLSPQTAAIGSGQTIQLSATITNTKTGVVSQATSENDSTGVSWQATTGMVDENGNYTPPSDRQGISVSVTATSKVDKTKSGVATIHVVSAGTVSTTENPQVALYSITPGGSANVQVQFGMDTNYRLTTSTASSTDTTAVNLFVAGMLENTAYHMRAKVTFSDGTQFTDTDHTFTTSAVTPTQAPPISGIATPGSTPQSGVELLNPVTGTARPTVTDLSGNVLWTYINGPDGLVANPIKLLANGHFLINFSNSSVDGSNSILREIDLAGNLIWQMTAADLNKALSTATCAGCNVTVVGTHHDFVMLPNGHLVVLAATQQDVSGTTVTGDVLIDLDPNRNPVWVWNEFDHLDINRRPYLYPDWTHSNAVIYSPDDGNLIVSIRHQNWLVKVDYENGQGGGDILWRLGYQGDFTLIGGTDPTDWFYAQHGPSFAGTNTAGKFSLVLFDNGDDRVFPSTVTCGMSGAPPCLYSTVPVLEIDETAKTATLTFHHATPGYSFFGGNAEILGNGNVEFCESAGGATNNSGEIYEVMQDATAETVWHMEITGQDTYRGQRLPSLYPGVQW